jgi:hypothetical protein
LNDGTVYLEFGSRSGSFFALALFGTVFGLVGVAAAFGLRQRFREVEPWQAILVGLALFVLPVGLIYSTSLAGFYEAEVRNGQLSLRYLLPQVVTVFPLAEVSEVSAAPAFRGRWRLHIVTVEGHRYESATWYRGPVTDAAIRLLSLRQAYGSGPEAKQGQ